MEVCMTRSPRWFTAALILSSLSSTALAGQDTWDGTWCGAWGGSRPTSITIANERVLSYEYGGSSTPVSISKVTESSVTYTNNGIVVTLIKTGKTTASAKIHSPMGDATAELKRQ
jgi:hypothetical protein